MVRVGTPTRSASSSSVYSWESSSMRHLYHTDSVNVKYRRRRVPVAGCAAASLALLHWGTVIIRGLLFLEHCCGGCLCPRDASEHVPYSDGSISSRGLLCTHLVTDGRLCCGLTALAPCALCSRGGVAETFSAGRLPAPGP